MKEFRLPQWKHRSWSTAGPDPWSAASWTLDLGHTLYAGRRGLTIQMTTIMDLEVRVHIRPFRFGPGVCRSWHSADYHRDRFWLRDRSRWWTLGYWVTRAAMAQWQFLDEREERDAQVAYEAEQREFEATMAAQADEEQRLQERGW